MKFLLLLKKIYIVIYKLCFKFVYKTSSYLLKTDEQKVIIALYRTERLEGNLTFIYDEIKKQLPGAKIHLVYGENRMNLKLFKEILLLSNARYLILDDYYLPVYLIKPQKELKVIQLWHAAGALKKFGYSTAGTKFGPRHSYLKLVPIHSNYTHVYISSDKFKNYYAEAFNMNPERIFALGIPRTDMFNHTEACDFIKNSIHKDFPILINEKSVDILIAPTYRAVGSQVESSLDIISTVINISKLINTRKRIIFIAHPYMSEEDVSRLDECTNVLVPNEYTINEWMLVADAFITDYSSSIFEFALLNKPMAHFVPDLIEYEYNRGFYQNIERISDGEILKNNVQLIDWINARDYNEFFDSSRMVKYNFDNVDNVSKRIVKHFIS